MPKRCKGCHCAQATERHRAQTTQSRQKPPAPHPPAPQAPDPPFRSRGIAKAGPGGRGWIIGLDQPPPSLSRLRRSHRTRTTSSIPNQQAHHAAPRGRRTSPACGSCRRPRKERQRKRGAMSRRTTNLNEKNKENARETKKNKTYLREEARPAMNQRVRRPTSQNHCFQGAKTTFRLHERQKASCEGPKCIIFHHNNEASEKTIKNNPFPPLAADAEARRTLGNAYLCMVPEGDRSPPVAAAVKKEPPSATHGSLVVIEHGRTHKTTIRCPLFALETRTPSL